MANNNTGLQETVIVEEGCIHVTRMDPGVYDDVVMRRSTFLYPRLDRHEVFYELTTYTSKSVPCLNDFLINKRIYQMATEVFYGKNVFHVEHSAIVVPFLKDRGAHNLKLIRKLSIPYCSPLGVVLLQYREDRRIADVDGEERVWRNACRFLSIHLPNLKKVELRFEYLAKADPHTSRYHTDPMLTWDAVGRHSFMIRPECQSRMEFTWERITELATIGRGAIFTLSSQNRESAGDRIIRLSVYALIAKWVGQKIDNRRMEISEDAKELAPGCDPKAQWEAMLKDFWKFHLRPSGGFRPV